MCQKVEATGISWIAVHGRKPDAIVLKDQPVDYETIKLIKDSVRVPVVANGDAFNLSDCHRIAAETGVDGIMAARGLLRNPTMFAGFDKTPFSVMREWIAMFEGDTDYLAWTECHHHLLRMLQPYISKEELGEFSGLLKHKDTIVDFIKTKLPDFDAEFTQEEKGLVEG